MPNSSQRARRYRTDDAPRARSSRNGNFYDGTAARMPEEVPVRERRRKPKHAQTSKQREKLIRMTEKQIRAARFAGVNPVKAFSSAALVVIAFVLVFEVILANVKLNEVSTQINSAQTELAQLKGTEIQLTMQESMGTTGTQLEDYAKNTLGMTKVKNDQIIYVNLNDGDTAIIEDGGSENFFQKIWNTVSSWFE